MSNPDSLDGEEEEVEGGNLPSLDPALDNKYYGFLNVPRTAEQSEITAAYKRLARLYHPDKHQDPTKRAQAEVLFSKLKHAYEILSDPHKRAIYDCLGEEGLKEQGWEVVQRTRTPQEIRAEYESLAKLREERRLQQRTNPTSKLTMTVNATDLFDRYLYSSEYDDIVEGDLPQFEVSDIKFEQTIEAPLTPTDTATLSGHVSTKNGTGGGGVGLSVRRIGDNGAWQEVEAGVGHGLVCGAKANRRLGSRTFVTMSGSAQFAPRGFRPDLSVSLGHQLDQHTMGYLTYSTKLRLANHHDEGLELTEEESGMCTMLVRDTEQYNTSLSLQLGIPYTYAMFSYTHKFPKQKRRCRLAVKAGTFGAILEYGVEEKVTSQSNVSATMLVGFPLGVTCRLKLTRSSQTYVFPFHLSDEILVQPIFYGTICPVVLWFTIKKLVLEPLEVKRREEKRRRKREANKEKVAIARREAEASISLMEERFARIVREEEAKGGLVICAALYGRMEDSGGGLHRSLAGWEPPSSQSPELEYISVLRPFQCEVEESRLVLWEGQKSCLPGVWDPAPGEEKQLLIRYTFQGHKHQLFCPEEEAVKLPKTAHRLP